MKKIDRQLTYRISVENQIIFINTQLLFFNEFVSCFRTYYYYFNTDNIDNVPFLKMIHKHDDNLELFMNGRVKGTCSKLKNYWNQFSFYF